MPDPYQIPAGTPRPASLRYLIAGYLRDGAGRSVLVVDVVTSDQPLTELDVPDKLLAKANRTRNDLHADRPLRHDLLLALLPIPRPAIEDHRPLLAWKIEIYFVAHDVKFGGGASGVFGWPEEPKGTERDAFVMLLINDTLARRQLEPVGNIYSDVISVTITPSSDPPWEYA